MGAPDVAEPGEDVRPALGAGRERADRSVCSGSSLESLYAGLAALAASLAPARWRPSLSFRSRRTRVVGSLFYALIFVRWLQDSSVHPLAAGAYAALIWLAVAFLRRRLLLVFAGRAPQRKMGVHAREIAVRKAAAVRCGLRSALCALGLMRPTNLALLDTICAS